MTGKATGFRAALAAHAARADGVLVGEAVGVAGLSAGVTGNLVLTPLSEAGAVGLAAGLALIGKRPVVELLDVAGVERAFESLGDAGSLAARSGSAFAAPLVVLAPLPPAADLPRVPPGVQLAVAATPAAAAALFAAALGAAAPVVLLLADDALATGAAAAGESALGVPVVVREGHGAIVLAEGAGVPLALAAAGEATVVDLAGCRDATRLGALVAPTGRVVVVAHGGDSALLAILAGAFWRLESQPRFVHPREGASALAAALVDALTP
jgi:pyruvate/2-oxoglutarate/acetoin dehydrogenase E1 component